MTKTALLHIGTPKTGTTSIQHCLARAQADGCLGPVRYPSWGGVHDHNECLLMLYRPFDELPLSVRKVYPKDDSRYRAARWMYRRRLFVRAAARAYRSVPATLRPSGLDSRLRALRRKLRQ